MSRQVAGQMGLFEQVIDAPPPRRPPAPVRRRSPGSDPPRYGSTARLPGLDDAGSVSICVLGSGSSGNASVVRFGGQTLLIDAGLGPRVTAARLRATGLDDEPIGAVCLTHLDRDHFNPSWIATLVRRRTHVFVHHRHIEALYRLDPAWALHRAGLLHDIGDRCFDPLPGLSAQPIPLPHDRAGTVGFVFTSAGTRLGYATDLGHVPDELVQAFAAADLVAIESNYDPDMQRSSPRPERLKRRIMGGWGHLSNEQAFDAVRRLLDLPKGGPDRVVLLHRSQQCNRPDLVQRVFAQDPRLAGRVILSEQSITTGWLAVGGQAIPG